MSQRISKNSKHTTKGQKAKTPAPRKSDAITVCRPDGISFDGWHVFILTGDALARDGYPKGARMVTNLSVVPVEGELAVLKTHRGCFTGYLRFADDGRACVDYANGWSTNFYRKFKLVGRVEEVCLRHMDKPCRIVEHWPMWIEAKKGGAANAENKERRTQTARRIT